MTCLTFNSGAEAAVDFYLSVFRDGRVLHKTYFGSNDFGPEGGVRTIVFELFGQRFWAVNGGELFSFAEGNSIYVLCKDQTEADFLWKELSEGGRQQECGWLTDKFGVTWQIVPEAVYDMVNSDNTEKANRAIKAIYKMKKLDLKTIQRAFDGEI